MVKHIGGEAPYIRWFSLELPPVWRHVITELWLIQLDQQQINTSKIWIETQNFLST